MITPATDNATTTSDNIGAEDNYGSDVKGVSTECGAGREAEDRKRNAMEEVNDDIKEGVLEAKKEDNGNLGKLTRWQTKKRKVHTRRLQGPITLKAAYSTRLRESSCLEVKKLPQMDMADLEGVLRLGMRIDGPHMMVRTNPQIVTQVATLAMCRSLHLQPDPRGNIHVDPTELISRIQALGNIPITLD